MHPSCLVQASRIIFQHVRVRQAFCTCCLLFTYRFGYEPWRAAEIRGTPRKRHRSVYCLGALSHPELLSTNFISDEGSCLGGGPRRDFDGLTMAAYSNPRCRVLSTAELTVSYLCSPHIVDHHCDALSGDDTSDGNTRPCRWTAQCIQRRRSNAQMTPGTVNIHWHGRVEPVTGQALQCATCDALRILTPQSQWAAVQNPMVNIISGRSRA